MFLNDGEQHTRYTIGCDPVGEILAHVLFSKIHPKKRTI
jgi:hypothetical protein